MLYELIAVVRPGNLAEVRDIATSAGRHILRGGGVIRSLDNWGVYSLPRPATRQEIRHYNGHYFCVRYDSGVQTQETLRRILRLDPRVIRATSVKLGDQKLETMSRFGQLDWVRSQ